MFQSTLQSLTTLGSKGDAVVRALASHHWPGFESWRRRHMWVDFVVGSLACFERVFSVYSGFPLSLKTNASKTNSIWNAQTRFPEFLRTPKRSVGKEITITIDQFSQGHMASIWNDKLKSRHYHATTSNRLYQT